jgi:hypothetical protein
MTWLRRAPVSAVLLAACNNPDEADPPPVNAAIATEAGARTLPLAVRCTGPADELALLGDLCGSSSELLGWSNTEIRGGEGFGTVVGRGAARLMLFAEVDGHPDDDDNVADRLAYAAYVVLDAGDPDGFVAQLEQWQDGEPVTSGHVRTELAEFVACYESWIAEGTFVWRDTTIELGWTAVQGC